MPLLDLSSELIRDLPVNCSVAGRIDMRGHIASSEWYTQAKSGRHYRIGDRSMRHSPQHSVSVAAVIVDDGGQILMTQRRDNGHWEPPGGVLELSESILDGLRREVWEETGLEVEPGRLTGIYKNMPRGIVALVFRARVLGGIAAQATTETAQVKWLRTSDIIDRCDEAYAVRVLDALAGEGVAIRAHDGVRVLADVALPRRPGSTVGEGR